MILPSHPVPLVVVIFIASGNVQLSVAASNADITEFVADHCLACHDSTSAEANLDLERLTADISDRGQVETWVKVHDRVRAGEMPPANHEQIPAPKRQKWLNHLASQLREAILARQAFAGRVQYRRLNRVEYQNTLRDLFQLPHLEVKEILPADSSAHGFDNVGSALNLSYVQLSRYLEAAEAALRTAMVLEPRPSKEITQLVARTNGRFSQVLRKGREAVAVGEAVGLLRQPNTAQAPWWWSKYAPPIAGEYRLRMKACGFRWERGHVLPADRTHVVTFHAVQGTTKRPLGTFDVPGSPVEPTILDFTAFLRPGDQIQIWFETLDDFTKPSRIAMEDYSADGVSVEWLEIEGPLIDAWPPASYRRLFGDLHLTNWSAETGLKEPALPIIVDGVGKRARRQPAKPNKVTLRHVVTENPFKDAETLLYDFAERAFRRPVSPGELDDYVSLVQAKLDQQACFQEAMRIGYQAILCSPDFLFLNERPGRLDDYALASRLSYFLWSSLPDDELLSMAAAGELQDPAALRQQTERMLDDPKSQRFAENFCGQWLDLRRITVTQPDEHLNPEFDQLLLSSMKAETEQFFTEMLQHDLGVTHVIDSGFVMVNERLAELYEIPDVRGVSIQRVDLPDDSPRGGFLTQASILKITANGTTTSPVTRGAWVLDRLLGQPPRPPPPNVPAVEPDLRGTTTIRDQLAKHRDHPDCASCHQEIDPPGFALENFDVIGGWRDRYRVLQTGDDPETTDRGNRPVNYKLGLPVDASGVAPSGKTFDDIHGFRRILLVGKQQIAQNLIERLLVYATGAGIEFADRAAVAAILEQTEDQDYGLRSLVHAVVQSETFRRK